MIIQAEIIEKPRRRCLPSHHRLSLRSLRATESAQGALLKREFFNTIRPGQPLGRSPRLSSKADVQTKGLASFRAKTEPYFNISRLLRNGQREDCDPRRPA